MYIHTYIQYERERARAFIMPLPRLIHSRIRTSQFPRIAMQVSLTVVGSKKKDIPFEKGPF